MNRRHFVSRAMLGAAAACTTVARPSFAAPSASGQLNLRFVGMMGFIERMDRSFLVATPGQSHHMTHIPFLMARMGSPVAKALGCAPVAGVVPEAFDSTLEGSNPAGFVFRSLQNTALEIVSGDTDAVSNNATQMAQMNKIAPGKRVRGNIEKWASSTVSLRGGRLENSAGHPDAGKVWKFGEYSQQLTDAVNFTSQPGAATTLRVTSSTEARTFKVEPGDNVELWVFSAATMAGRGGNPTKLTHSELLFDYLVDARPVLAECPDAKGRPIPATDVPYVNPTSASVGIAASETRFPPDTEICFLAAYLLDLLGVGSK
jgi:hypothetical protein